MAGIGAIVGQALGGIFGPVAEIIKEVVPDKDKRDELAARLAEARALAELRLDELEHELLKGQIELNKAEAAGDRIQRWWRPAVGWVCAFGFLYATVLRWIAADFFGVTLPAYDDTLLTTVLLGMLGIGGLRSFDKWAEKKRSVATEEVKATERIAVAAGVPVTADMPVMGQNAARVKAAAAGRRWSL